MLRRRRRSVAQDLYDIEAQRPLIRRQRRRVGPFVGLSQLARLMEYGIPAGYAAWKYGSYKAKDTYKKILDKRNGPPKKPPEDKSGMPYRKSKKGRSYKKKTWKPRRKRRGRRRSSKGFLKAKIIDIITPKRTLYQTFSSLVEENTDKNQNLVIFDVTHTKWAYENLIKATGQNSTTFAVDSGAIMKDIASNVRHKYELRNASNQKVFVDVWKCRMRRDLHDEGADTTMTDRTGQYHATNVLTNIIVNALESRANTTVDGSIAPIAADETNNRYPSRVCMPDVLDFHSSTCSKYFYSKKLKSRILEPGDVMYANIVDRRHYNIDGNLNLENSFGVEPELYGGRSEFLIFKFRAAVVGTSEAEGGAGNDDKVSVGTFQIHCNWSVKMDIKTLSPSMDLIDHQEYRPAISEANMEFMGDDQDAVIVNEEL